MRSRFLGVAARRPFGLLAIALTGLVLSGITLPALAQPWLSVGDRGLRSDVEILSAYGLIDGLVTTWPIPEGQLKRLLNREAVQNAPDFVQAAASRVLHHLPGFARDLPTFTTTADLRFTNSADTIRDFGTEARDEADVRGGFVWGDNGANLGLDVGAQTHFNGDDGRPSLDGSFGEVLIGNTQLYGGFIDDWYGPGWTSSLLLSNNARPFPKIGLTRNDPHAFKSPWLSWIGPWQFNFFVGVLDGPRVDTNTVFQSVRLSFNPLPGLEIALTRDTELCGAHHPCNPPKAEVDVNNSPNSVDETNEEGGIDLKYTHKLGLLSISPYVQFMNEDTGPFVHAYTNYLVGTTVAGPWRDGGGQWRVTLEDTDTVSTLNIFDFGKKATGTAYTNAGYIDGFRYRDRTLGFSLDSDSRLLSLAGQITDRAGWTWRAVYYRGRINSGALAKLEEKSKFASNIVSSEPVFINQLETGVSVPYHAFSFDLSLRAQDAQPFPDGGGKFSAEGGISYRF